MSQQFHSQEYIKKNQNTNFKTYLHPNDYSSIVYNCQDMDAT